MIPPATQATRNLKLTIEKHQDNLDPRALLNSFLIWIGKVFSFLILIDSNVLNPFFKHNLDEPTCDITKNWCGWRSIRGWKRISHRDLEQQGSEESRADDNADSTNERGTLCWVFF